jgi:hypothetical protein
MQYKHYSYIFKWCIVTVTIKRIIKENYPDYPAVLLLVVPSGPKSSKTGTCIAKQLTKIVNTLYNVTSAKIIDIPNDIGLKWCIVTVTISMKEK